jgi:[ribosomal protein S18]-alanine N-acetyltransferase
VIGMAGDVQIRPMTAADLARVMEIAASLPDAPHWRQDVYGTALDPNGATRRIALVAAASQTNDVQGFTIASLLPPTAELETIAVASDFQRCGLGRQLFEALAMDVRVAGAREMVLEVRASNHAALGFYRSIGFGKTGLRRNYYEDPQEDAVLMRLRLQ